MISDEQRKQEEQEENLVDHYDDETGKPTEQLPLGSAKVVLSSFLGIAAVFASMMVINSYIFRFVPDIKTSYYVSIFISNLLFLLVVVIIKLSRNLTWSSLGWNNVNFLRSFKAVFKVWALIGVGHIIYMLILAVLEITPPENVLTELLQRPTLLMLFANIFLIAIVAPVIEETLFRGLLLSGLRTYFGVWTAIILSAAIFSALHFELIGFIPRFALGIGLGYLYYKSGSIYPAIGLHSLNNLIAVLIISSAP